MSKLALADSTVTTCDQSSLESALAGGGNVSFGCSGVIVLTNTISILADTVLDGTGQSVTISGNDAVRIFNVGSNVSLTIVSLTLTHGHDIGSSGPVPTPGADGKGGAVFIDGGILTALNCHFSTNLATGGTGNSRDAGRGCGGAIYNRGGMVKLTKCDVVSNQAIGGIVINSPVGLRNGDGIGGAIYNEGGGLAFAETRLLGNSAQGTVAISGYDGAAFGGAVYSTNGTLFLENCIVSSNETVVGPVRRGSVPGATGGGALYVDTGSVGLVSSLFSYNRCQGDGGLDRATEGAGGSIFNFGDLTITNCTFLGNTATGGTGRGVSQPGNGGAIYNLSNTTIVGSTLTGNSAIGGDGFGDLQSSSSGAAGQGGGIYSSGMVSLVNCTLFQNLSFGGNGANLAGLPATFGGPGYGGAVYVGAGTFAAANVTFADNAAKGGLDGTMPISGGRPTNAEPGLGGAMYLSAEGVATVVNTILANSVSGGNCFGILSDGGHNISSDATCKFSAAGSLNSTDPVLGPFGSYGGSTATIPLLYGSPAIDAGASAACPAIDQRGISRPYGNSCDIGAFESTPLYTVNGHIRGFLSPAAVAVNIDSNSVSVDASGFYTFTGLAPGNYAVTPSAPQTRFVPATRVVRVGPDSPDTDFKAYQVNALAVEVLANGDFQIVYAGDFGTTYQTQVSTNLFAWSPYSTNSTDTNGVFAITNLNNGADSSRFLRVREP
jgi:hypothetical protein